MTIVGLDVSARVTHSMIMFNFFLMVLLIKHLVSISAQN
jgi:hypothetical protein